VISVKVLRLCFVAVLATLMLAPVSMMTGCGHTDEEMAQKQREIDKLTADLKAAQKQIADDQAKYTDGQNQIEQMKEQLKQAGLSADRSKEEAARLQQALAEYKQRAEQLAQIEARFRDLRSRLEALTKVGLKVVVRNNRMVIQLPGDVLFDSGKDELKPQGKDVLAQVADVVRNDPDLNKRNFQVAGHTDNAKYPPGGPFHDNWGLSLARARQVLLFLIAPNATSKAAKVTGGGLDPKHWAASGYGETDPQAGTVTQQAPDEMQKNRRVELVLQPNVEEMINLNNIK
jgi:chemotaxis protein MotB